MEQITITREEFKKKAIAALDMEEAKDDGKTQFMIMLVGMLVIQNIEKQLFGEEKED